MQTGFVATSVISWSQTEVDGIGNAAPDLVAAGALWRWTGRALRLDSARDILRLDPPEGGGDLQERAARRLRQIMAAKPGRGPQNGAPGKADPAPARAPDFVATGAPDFVVTDTPDFVVTDGRRSFAATILPAADGIGRIVLFAGPMPPADCDLWVVRAAPALAARRRGAQDHPEAGGLICFVPGTRLATPEGPRRVETLRPGDRVLTRDNGPRPVIWSGHRHMTGARLYAMPQLRPIRLRGGALGQGAPEGDLLVSPCHRMLVRGRAAQALFGTDEVLAAAQDLLNDRTVTVERSLREVTYVHVLLEANEILWANGLETESFHPSPEALLAVEPLQRQALMAALSHDPAGYGAPARRCLAGWETAILRHELAA